MTSGTKRGAVRLPERCPVGGCYLPRDPDSVLCRDHWNGLDDAQRDALVQTYLQHGRSPQYADAVRSVIAEIQDAKGWRRPPGPPNPPRPFGKPNEFPDISVATQRGARLGEQVTFYDAVADDPDMTPEQQIHWLRITAADYLEKLEVAETLIAGHKMRYDALVETMRREGAKLEAAQHVVALVRELRDECHNGIGNDDLPLRLMLLFGALTDYAAANAHDAGEGGL